MHAVSTHCRPGRRFAIGACQQSHHVKPRVLYTLRLRTMHAWRACLRGLRAMSTHCFQKCTSPHIPPCSTTAYAQQCGNAGWHGNVASSNIAELVQPCNPCVAIHNSRTLKCTGWDSTCCRRVATGEVPHLAQPVLQSHGHDLVPPLVQCVADAVCLQAVVALVVQQSHAGRQAGRILPAAMQQEHISVTEGKRPACGMCKVRVFPSPANSFMHSCHLPECSQAS